MTLGIKLRAERTRRLHMERQDSLEHLYVMRRQERQNYSFKKPIPTSPEDDAVDEATRKVYIQECRQKICDWMYAVVDHFKMDREVVLVAFHFVDRFLSTQSRCNSKFFKILSMTALFVASKLFYGHMFTVNQLVQLSRFEFRAKQIEQMELHLLRSLRWFVHPPTTKSVLRDLLSLLRPGVTSHVLSQLSEYSNFLAEISVYDNQLVSEPCSKVAVACLATALDWIEDSDIGDQRESIISQVLDALELKANFDDDKRIECRLLEVYSQTEECRLSLDENDGCDDEFVSPKRARLEGDCSPVNVTEIDCSCRSYTGLRTI